MPSHWTYCEFKPNDDLAQGDVLKRTDELVGLLNRVHAHFCDEKYLGFLVVTHTCDLVTRGGNRCKAHHVGLSVVRALDAVLPDLLGDLCGTGITDLYDTDLKSKAAELLQRILNQNEQAIGLFYLHPDVDAGIAEPSVAQLRITISFRAEHYPILKAARVGRLDPQFSSKLGWLSGSLYSRVATPDWSEHANGREEQRKLIAQFLSSRSNWISGKWVKNAKKAQADLSKISAVNAQAALEQYAPADPRKIVLERVQENATKLFPSEIDDKVKRLVERLRSDPGFQDAFK